MGDDSDDLPTMESPTRQLDRSLHDLANAVGSTLAALTLLGQKEVDVDVQSRSETIRGGLIAAELAAELVLTLRSSRSDRDPQVALSRAIERAVAIVRPFVAPPSTLISTHIPGAFVGIPETVLVRVLTNVVLNAARAADPSRPNEIRIGTRETTGGVLVTVRDCGTGASVDRLERLASSGAARGLAIARDLLSAYSGHLAIESSIGVGTTVSLELPLAAHPVEDTWARSSAT